MPNIPFKLDGTRALVIKEGDMVHIQNRKGVIYTKRLPEIVRSAKQLADDFILDGEIRALDGSFTSCQRRCATSDLSKIPILRRQLPVKFVAFDILRLDEDDLRHRPWIERKLTLRRLIPHWFTLATYIGYLPHRYDLREFYEKVCRLGGEGVVLKAENSPYEHRRSQSWLKVKRWLTETLDVTGWTESSKGRPFGSLVLAKDGIFRGCVGSGFSDRELKEIAAYLRSCREIPKPFEIDEPYIAVKTDMKVEVRFLEWTKDGKLRFPTYLRKL